MKLVVDSNVLFAALISGRKVYLDVFSSLEIYTPDFIFIEIEKYQERIIKKTKLADEINVFTRKLFSEIIVIPKLGISDSSFQQAFSLCTDIDPKDTPFVALSIELKLPLWTKDQKLIDGLQAQGFHDIVTTEEIFEVTIGSKK